MSDELAEQVAFALHVMRVILKLPMPPKFLLLESGCILAAAPGIH